MRKLSNFHIEGRFPEKEELKVSSAGPFSLDIYQLQGMETVKTVKIKGHEDNGILSLRIVVEDLDGETSYSNIVTIKGRRDDDRK